MDENGSEPSKQKSLKSLVVVCSFHHKNTEKVAKAIAAVLGAPIKTPQEAGQEDIGENDLIGFGSGIYSATYDPSMLALADSIPHVAGKKAFLFSTFGAPAFAVDTHVVEKNHRQIRDKLHGKGFVIIGEFACPGWNTNSFLKYFGGLNKNRPDAADLENAGAFAREMGEKARGEGK